MSNHYSPIPASAHAGVVTITSTTDDRRIVVREAELGFPSTYSVGFESFHAFDFDEDGWEESIRTLSEATA